MKIKHLIIRNIASVESADIDFEHGPVDRSTGRPASLFLITGDTGSGKSVILDCISMALYGTTPRVKGVNGIKNNTYTYGNGNEVAVNDIKQYTRLGISHKDPCYALLVFEGNDGVVYESRFELGFTNRHTYREPKWILKIGKSGQTDRKDEIRSRIENAVGLSFDQFGRMAMLAQGQFANFLTGKKEERERILEQLTATDRFSRYGEAISNIFKRAKENRTIAENQFNTYKDLILADNQVAELRAELDSITAEVGVVEAASKAETALEKASAGIKNAEARLAECRQLFDVLEADLCARRSALGLRLQALEDEHKWIEALGNRRQILDDAGVIIELIKAFLKIGSDIAIAQKKLADAETERAKWAIKVTETEREAKEAATAVNKAKLMIDELTAERSKMQPENLLVQHNEATLLHQSLIDLRKAIRQAETDKCETTQVQAEVEKLKENVGMLANQSARARDEEVQLDKEARRAEELYTTMHLSVEKNFTELRRRLADEHASHCPLCRREITDHANLISGDEFSKVLSPLEEEKNRLSSLHKAAKDRLSRIDGELKNMEGSLKTRNSELSRLLKRDSEAAVLIMDGLKNLAISPELKPDEEIDRKIQQSQARLDAIKGKIEMAEVIQGRINKAIIERNKLDRAQSTADNAFKYAGSKFEIANLTINAANETLTALAKEQMTTKERLDNTMQDYNESWSDDPLLTISTLKSEADAYAVRKEKINSTEKEIGSESAILGSLERTADTLRPIMAHIPVTASNSGRTLACMSLKEASDKWIQLHSTVAGVQGNLEGYRSEIESNKEILNFFHQHRPQNDPYAGVPLTRRLNDLNERKGAIIDRLKSDTEHRVNAERLSAQLEASQANYERWSRLNSYFGGTRFRTLVQSHILRPLLRNANVYLEQITDHYTLTCSDDNEQLSILVLDRYNRNETRSVTVLSGGERFMISLALSLALSAMSRPDMNVDILFIDEGFGTLDSKSLDQVMSTLRRLPMIAGQTGRRVGVISHREELAEQIDARIILRRCGEGRSRAVVE